MLAIVLNTWEKMEPGHQITNYIFALRKIE
jgi:hypothetical protein